MTIAETNQVQETKLFHLALYGPIAIALSSALVLWFRDGYLWRLQLDAEGFEHFLSAFRLPLLCLAAAPPLVALVLANHRANQSTAIFRAQLEQNRFTNSFKHLEEFEKYMEGKFPRMVMDVRHLHDLLYPDFRLSSANYSDPWNLPERILEKYGDALPTSEDGRPLKTVFDTEGNKYILGPMTPDQRRTFRKMCQEITILSLGSASYVEKDDETETEIEESWASAARAVKEMEVASVFNMDRQNPLRGSISDMAWLFQYYLYCSEIAE